MSFNPNSNLYSNKPLWNLISGNKFVPPFRPPSGAGFTNTKSMQFVRASNQYLNLGNNIQIQANQPISFSCWVYQTQNIGSVIISNESTTQGYAFYVSGSVRFEVVGGSGGIFATTVSLPQNVWVHVVATYDGSSSNTGLAIYFNGVAQTLTRSGSTVGTITYTKPTTIGRDDFSGAWDGYIDELSVWSKALSPTEVTALYNNGLPGDLTGKSGLSHWYRMGDGPGDTSSTIKDQAGAVDGTITNAATAVNFTPFYIPRVISTTQVKNDPDIAVPLGNKLFIPYYQSGNTDPGYEAPDLEVWDYSTPATPSLTGTLAHTGLVPFIAAFAPGNNRYLYVAYYKDTAFLRVIDVIDPANPTIVGSVSYGAPGNLIQSNSLAFSSDGKTAYVSGSQSLLAVVDISTPTSPSLTTTITVSPSTGNNDAWTAVGVSGNYLYLSGDVAHVLIVYDISTPSTPSFVTSIATDGGYSIAFSPDQNHLYLSAYSTGFIQVIDITTRTAPVVKGSVSQGAAVFSQYYGNNLLYTVSSTPNGNSFVVSSIYNPNAPFNVFDTTPMTGATVLEPTALTIAGKYAFITSLVVPGGGGVGDILGYLQIWQIAA